MKVVWFLELFPKKKRYILVFHWLSSKIFCTTSSGVISGVTWKYILSLTSLFLPSTNFYAFLMYDLNLEVNSIWFFLPSRFRESVYCLIEFIPLQNIILTTTIIQSSQSHHWRHLSPLPSPRHSRPHRASCAPSPAAPPTPCQAPQSATPAPASLWLGHWACSILSSMVPDQLSQMFVIKNTSNGPVTSNL